MTQCRACGHRMTPVYPDQLSHPHCDREWWEARAITDPPNVPPTRKATP